MLLVILEAIDMVEIDRRQFLKSAAGFGGLVVISKLAPEQASAKVPKNAMLVEVGKCIGCMRCVAACANYHGRFFNDTVEGTAYTKVPLIGGRKPFPQNCMHCVSAPCATVCESHALEQLDSGAVVYDRERCIGCLQCASVCPFESISYDPVSKRIFKCDLCSKQTEEGGTPNCVTVCPPHAKTWGPYAQKVQEGLALAQSTNGKLLFAEDTATLLMLTGDEFNQLLSTPEVTVVKPQYPNEYRWYSTLVRWSRLAWVPFFGGTMLLGLVWRTGKEKKAEGK